MSEVEKKGRNNGKYARNKGHNLERLIVNKFKELGYSFCKTSRNASKILDDSKVDIAFIPYNVQCKAGYPKGLNYPAIFDQMDIGLKLNFPPNEKVHTYPKVIIHDKGRRPIDKLVVIPLNDFFDIIKNIEINDI